MPRFVDYLQGKLHLDDMISRRIKLQDVNAALAALKQAVARSVMFD
jgi:Zn-dependent alcohol dehydrogenase